MTPTFSFRRLPIFLKVTRTRKYTRRSTGVVYNRATLRQMAQWQPAQDLGRAFHQGWRNV